MIDSVLRLHCWGENDNGELGMMVGTTCGTVPCSRDPLNLGFGGVEAAAIGGDHACASHAGGVSCWGLNESGQLGLGAVSAGITPITTWSTACRFTSLAAGAAHTCGVGADGSVACWGSNEHGQLGVMGAPETCGGEPCAPRAIATGVTSALEVATTNFSTCVRTVDDILCWGRNESGELGRGNVVSSPTPMPIALTP